MITKVFVPLDGSQIAEQVLPYARLIGEVANVPVGLLSVDDAANSSEDNNARDYLEMVARQFPATLKVELTVEHGNPAEVIVKRAQREPGSLIAMATHGSSGIKRWLLGSVASKVIQAAENPLLIVRAAGRAEAKSEARFESIIVPLDGSELAESVLPTVFEFAKATKAEIVLARAYQVPATAYYRADDTEGVEAFIPSYEELVAVESREAREYLDAKAKEVRAQGVAKVSTELLAGPAAEQIIDLGRHRTGALIALATHGRSGVSRWVLGSVAEKVVRRAENPVLLLRSS